MNVKTIAGAVLIILAIANLIQAFVATTTGTERPGYTFGLVTSLLLTFGVVLLVRGRKAKRPSIVED